MTDIVEKLRALDAWALHDAAEVMRQAADEIEWLRKERDRLANDLAQAHRDFQPWIAKVGQLTAKNSDMLHALRGIGMPGVSISYCQDGHEMAVLIARDALKGDGSLTNQSNSAAERSAHVTRGSAPTIKENILVEVSKGVFQLKAVADAEKEVARLRGALEKIAHSGDCGIMTIVPDGDRHEMAIQTALDALRGPDNE